MSAYAQPTENLAAFNNIVFTDANDDKLTLTKAKSLFLGRTGTPISTATSTTFNGTVNGLTLSSSVGTRVGTGVGLSNGGAGMLMIGDGLVGGNTPSYTNNNVMVGENMGSGADLQYNTLVGLNIFKTSNGYPIGNTIMGYNTSNKLSGNYTTAIGFASAYNNTQFGDNNVSVGYNSLYANTTGNNNVAIGYNAFQTGTIFTNSTALGASTVIGASTSTAIGYGATTSAANEIVLGTTGETVNCKGTQASISLKTAKNISINGAVFGTGNSGSNSLFSGLLVGTANGADNTLYGKNSYDAAADGSSERNTVVGSNASNTGYGVMSDHTVVGYGAGGKNSTGSQQGITCLGSGANVLNTASNSTAIGIGAQATLANQIVLGRTNEFVECAGTNTTNGCLKLNGGVKLQTTYSSSPTSTMLGFQLSNVALPFAITSFTTTVQANISSAGIVLTAGIWSINYTIELLAITGPATVSAQTLYCSLTSAGAYSTRILISGITRIQSTYTYAANDTPAFSGCFSYYTSAGATVYPVFQIAFSSGTFSGTGYYTATRIG